MSLAFEKVSDELEEIRKTISLLSDRKEDEKSGYWTNMAERINRAFTVFYITAAVLFLTVIFVVWWSAHDEL